MIPTFPAGANAGDAAISPLSVNVWRSAFCDHQMDAVGQRERRGHQMALRGRRFAHGGAHPGGFDDRPVGNAF